MTRLFKANVQSLEEGPTMEETESRQTSTNEDFGLETGTWLLFSENQTQRVTPAPAGVASNEPHIAQYWVWLDHT